MINIKEIVENKNGITTLESYEEYKKRVAETGISLEDIESLSPDNIDSSEFWKYCDNTPELKKDSIACSITKDQTIEEANKRNYYLACELGVFSHVLKYKSVRFNVLDIGAGFGMLKEALIKHLDYSIYYGVDTYPKIGGVMKVKDCILPDEVLKNKYGFVFAINVFQHLSVRQRRSYYEQIPKILEPGGYFVLTTFNETETYRGFLCKDNQKRYVCHYGQFTEIQSIEETMDDLKKYFDIVSITQRLWDGSHCFHLQTKPTSICINKSV